jgi:ketosteroid isomerase-like protein
MEDVTASQTLEEAPMSVDTMQGLTAEYAEHVGRQDVAALVEHYGDEAEMLAPGIEAVRGKAAIGPFIKSLFDMGLGWVDFEPYAHEQDGSLGVEIGKYTMRTSSGGEVIDVGKYVSVRRQQPDGTWLIRADIYNSNRQQPSS